MSTRERFVITKSDSIRGSFVRVMLVVQCLRNTRVNGCLSITKLLQRINHTLRKEGEDTSSAQKKRQDEELTVWRIPQDLRS